MGMGMAMAIYGYGDDYVADDSDCNDADSTAYPGADEYCDGQDDDCDGDVDEEVQRAAEKGEQTQGFSQFHRPFETENRF